MNLIFFGIVVLVTLSIAIWLGRTLWLNHNKSNENKQHVVNASVLRDQLTELEKDLSYQTLSEQDFTIAKRELQQRVLQEATPEPDRTHMDVNGKLTSLIFIIALPLSALLLYFQLGTPIATQPSLVQSQPVMTETDIQNMVISLERKLADNPDDPEGWVMLARSYRYFGDYSSAADAFSRAGPFIQTDPTVLAEYAETLARHNNQGFTSEATAILEQALAINPDEPFALTLAGTAAFERGDHDAAIGYWQQLLAQLPPDSEAAQIITEGIERVQREEG